MDSIHELEMLLNERNIPFTFEEIPPYNFIFYPSRFNTVFTVSNNIGSDELHLLAKRVDVDLPFKRILNIINDHYFSSKLSGGGNIYAESIFD